MHRNVEKKGIIFGICLVCDWRCRPFLSSSSSSWQQEARWGLLSVTASPPACRFSTHTLKGDKQWQWDFIPSEQTVLQVKYRRRGAIYAEKNEYVKTGSSCTRSRNHPACKSVIILDLYLWGCRAEGPLVPYWGAKVRSDSVGDHNAWCRHTSVTRSPDNTGLHMVNIGKQPSGLMKQTCGITKTHINSSPYLQKQHSCSY